MCTGARIRIYSCSQTHAETMKRLSVKLMLAQTAKLYSCQHLKGNSHQFYTSDCVYRFWGAQQHMDKSYIKPLVSPKEKREV